MMMASPISDRIIFGLLGVAVFSKKNIGEVVPAGYHLTYGATHRLEINDWWGRARDFSRIVASDPPGSVTLDFSAWLADMSANPEDWGKDATEDIALIIKPP